MTTGNHPEVIREAMRRHPAGKRRESVRIPGAVSCHGPRHDQVGHLRPSRDAAPGDLATSPAARACLIILGVLLALMAVPVLIDQAWQHPEVSTIVIGMVLTAVVWRWSR